MNLVRIDDNILNIDTITRISINTYIGTAPGISGITIHFLGGSPLELHDGNRTLNMLLGHLNNVGMPMSALIPDSLGLGEQSQTTPE